MNTTREIPLFPLLNSLLIPGSVQGLRFFEPRYVQMMKDLLDAPPIFVFGTVLGDDPALLAGQPPVEPVGGLAEVLDYKELDNGEFLCDVLGRERVRIHEVDSDALYRRVEIEPVDGEIEDPVLESDLGQQLRAEIESRGTLGGDLPSAVKASSLGDLLLAQIDVPFKERYELYAMIEPVERLQAILAAAK